MPFGIGLGPDSREKQAYGGLNTLSGFTSTQGQNDIGLANKWISALLGGDRSKTMELLAPQISDMKARAGQQLLTNSQFGNRSGGTNASNQLTEDNVTSQIDRMISGLTSGAIGEAGSLGTSLLGQAGGNYANLFGEAKTMHDQNAAKWNDIFKSIGQIATGVMGGIGNLDTTGSSSFGEQVGNFMGGFGG